MDLTKLDDETLLIVFSGDLRTIDVDTISQALTGFAEALRAINDVFDPEYELEVSLEETSNSSFIAKLSLRRIPKGLYQRVGETLILGLLVNYLYDLANYSKPTFRLEGEEFVIETINEIIKLPADIVKYREKLAKDKTVARGVKKAFQAAREDEKVEAVSIKNRADQPAFITVPRGDFGTVVSNASKAIDGRRIPFNYDETIRPTRVRLERTSIVIVKAVLRRTDRKWQFTWHGRDISAPITDPTFFDRLGARLIKIAQGDSLDVDLAITESQDEVSGVWAQDDFAVVFVHGLVDVGGQSSLY